MALAISSKQSDCVLRGSRSRSCCLRLPVAQSRRTHVAAAGKGPGPSGDNNDDLILDPAARALSAAVVLGFTGTVAVVGAQLCGVNVFRGATLNPSDFEVAFLALTPVTLLEFFLFGLEHKVPEQFWKQQPAAASPGGSSSSSGDSSRVLDLNKVTAEGWSPAAMQLMLALYRDVQLGVITATNLPQLPIAYEAALLLGREASKEVLQRGYLLAALAGWLTDRLYEAGIDDMIHLQSLVKGSINGDTLTVPLVGSWLSAWLVATAFSPAAVAVAQEHLIQVSSAVLTLAGLKADGSSITVDATDLSQSAATSSSNSSSGQASTSKPSSSSSTAPVKEVVVVEADEEASSSMSAASQKMLQEYLTITKAEEVSQSPVAIASYWVSLTRQLLRIVAANSAFVVTGGNIAATFAAGSLSGLLVVLYGRLARSKAGSSPSGL